jgi:hypothetical protein
MEIVSIGTMWAGARFKDNPALLTRMLVSAKSAGRLATAASTADLSRTSRAKGRIKSRATKPHKRKGSNGRAGESLLINRYALLPSTPLFAKRTSGSGRREITGCARENPGRLKN